MKLLPLGSALIFSCFAGAATPADFDGATPQPVGPIEESVRQFKIKFPVSISKSSTESFKVTCTPEKAGYGSWADNNTIWTYNFKAADEDFDTRLAGGSKCQVVQVAEVKSEDGKVWKAGTINYSVSISGPNVESVFVPHGFNETLRETEPVVLIKFDGAVNRAAFFTDQNGFLSYTSANAPGEKLSLVPVPEDQQERLFTTLKKSNWIDSEFKNKDWILATVQQNLIPGAQVLLTVQSQTSADDGIVRATKKFTKEFSVRSQFQAEVKCSNPSAKSATCLPRSPISVIMNGRVKWADIKSAYIEYIPYKSSDKKLVRSYPELGSNQDVSLWASFLDTLSNYFPFLARFNDIVVDTISFNVNIEPESQAKVVLPKGISDIDGRIMTNAIAEFHIRVGKMSEIIRTPQQMSIFEKNVPGVYLPVGIVNLNQNVSIRQSGKTEKSWAPIQDVPTMIKLINAYANRGDYRTEPNYKSPMETLGLKSSVVEQKLTGAKNRPTYLQFPFAAANKTPTSGFYALEISSASYEKGRSGGDGEDNVEFFNPKYVLAQVSDLGVHIKKGSTTTVAWVTSLSKAQPVANAEVKVYNCNGEVIRSLKSDANGLVSFPTQKKYAEKCVVDKNLYSEYLTVESFYVAARTADDIVLTHSTWVSPNSYAMGAPGIEYFYGDIEENQVHFHSIIGVNLVKPGQPVPINIVAKMPNAKGFAEVSASLLPPIARIVNSEDGDIYYDLPLTWKNGSASIVWNVPGDSSVRLGRYSIQLVTGKKDERGLSATGDIEVAEFKVPLMSGIIAFPTQALVKPDSIPVSAIIRYANGIGAKSLGAELSYFFDSTSIEKRELPGFEFGSGPVKLAEDESSSISDSLPQRNRPAVITGLATGADGSLSQDIALEKAADGRTIAEILKSSDRPKNLIVRVRYQDQMGEYQTLSQAKTIYNANLYVGTNLKSGLRSEARLRAAVLDTNEKNLTSLQDLDFKLVRVDVKVIGEELFGGVIKNTLERTLKPVRWTPSCKIQDNVASCEVGALKAGNYAFEVTSRSAQQTSHQLFKVDTEGRVYGRDDYYQFGDEDGSKQLPLALNKAVYKDGEKAIVSFPSPFKSCRALVTIERSNVMQSFISSNACEKGFVEVPVNATLAPNAFVSIYAITGRAQSTTVKAGDLDLGRPTYRLGFANIKVNWSRFKSNVTVKTDKQKYEPGQMVNVEVNVHPEEGALAGGTVTLVAIEEKILELKKNDTYKILDALMQLRGHGVDTITSLGHIETVTTQNSEIDEEADGKGGDEGGDGGGSASEFKRRLFNALVSFQADVPVVNGVAKFAFKANDSLTRFKIFAISSDAAQKFGTGEATYLSEKDTQTYSNIPSVAHSGDSFPVKVTVQNNGSKAGKFKTEVVVTSKDANGKVIGTKTLTKESNVGSAASESIEAGQITVDEDASSVEYVVRIYDESGKLVDVLEPEAQIVLASVPLAIHDSYIVQVENNSFLKALAKEDKAIAGKGEIRVTLSKSLVSGADRQIQQRLDRDAFSDIFIESKFFKALMLSTEVKPAPIKALLESLVSATDSNGFLKYYSEAPRGSVWLTANVVNALQAKPWAMKYAPAALQEKLKAAISLVITKSVDPKYVGKTPMDWLRAQALMGRAAFAFDDKNMHANARAILVTALAELKNNPEAYGRTVEKWTNADLLNIWLLQVVAAPTQAPTSAFYQQLTGSRLVYVGNMAQLTGAPSLSNFYSDETIETSLLLFGHAKLNMDKNLARNLAVGLVNASQKAWYNVGTLYSVSQGLNAFKLAYEAEDVTGVATVAIPEQQKTGSVDWATTPIAELTTPWTESRATVKVEQSGEGRPWVGIQALTAVALSEAHNQGVSVEKLVKNISRETGFQAGDLLEVTLTIQSAGDLRHMAMNDPIPAGANIVADAYGSFSSGQKSYSGYKFYFDSLSKGATTVKYQYQLNNPGVFKLPPTHMSGLYMPGIFSDAPNATITVK